MKIERGQDYHVSLPSLGENTGTKERFDQMEKGITQINAGG